MPGCHFDERVGSIPFVCRSKPQDCLCCGKMFLIRNGRRLRVDSFEDAYPFIKNVEAKNIDEIQRWVEHGA